MPQYEQTPGVVRQGAWSPGLVREGTDQWPRRQKRRATGVEDGRDVVGHEEMSGSPGRGWWAVWALHVQEMRNMGSE